MSQTFHLDESRLSDLVDGEADPGDVEHATTCAECRARVAAWKEAQQLVAAAPPPPPAAQRDAAVAAALGAGQEAATPAVAAALGAGQEAAPPVVALADRRARRGRRIRTLAAVAAALVIVGVVAAVVHGGSHPSPNAASSGAKVSSPPAAAGPAPSQPAVANLGAVEGPGPLVAELRTALGARTPAAGATSATSAAPSKNEITACQTRAAADAHLPETSTPGFEASLTYRGVPAAAIVFDKGSQHDAVVVAEPGCALLADVTF